MDRIVIECLRDIENAALLIEKSVGKIVGWEVGTAQFGEAAANCTNNALQICTKGDDE